MTRPHDAQEPAPPIAVIGAGSTGTALAALVGRLAPVTLVCRNADRATTLAALGAAAVGAFAGRSHRAIVRSTADLSTVHGLRAIFVATKTTSIPAVAADLRALLPRLPGEPPFIVSFQNGIEPARELMHALGSDRVLRMVVNFGARLREPDGAAECTAGGPPSFIGCLNPDHRDACRRLAALLTSAGLPTQFDDQIELRIWTKAILNAGMNPVAALVNSTVDGVLDSPARTIVERLLREGIETAAAEGLDLGPDPLADARAALQLMRPHTPSMVEDIRAGRQSEVGQLNRQIVLHAKRLGVPVPTHETVQALIETFDWKVYRRCQTAPEWLPAAAAGAGRD